MQIKNNLLKNYNEDKYLCQKIQKFIVLIIASLNNISNLRISIIISQINFLIHFYIIYKIKFFKHFVFNFKEFLLIVIWYIYRLIL